MTALDQPVRFEPTPFKTRWTWVEKIICAVIVVFTTIREGLSSVWAYQVIFVAGVFAVALGVLYFIPENEHIKFTYRKYPRFVSYYDEHQYDGEFLKVFYGFFEDNDLYELE